MKEKCNKFEELFVSSDENALLEHIKDCEECKSEYKKMQKVSNLIQEVKPLYNKEKVVKMHPKRKYIGVMTMAASFLTIFLAFFAIQISTPNSIVNETIASISSQEYTYEQMGLPTDEYGLIMVDYDY